MAKVQNPECKGFNSNVLGEKNTKIINMYYCIGHINVLGYKLMNGTMCPR